MAGRSPFLFITIACFASLFLASFGAAEEDVLWPQNPIHIDRSKQHYERLPAVKVAIDRRTWLRIPPRIRLLDSAHFMAEGTIYHIADIHPVLSKRTCKRMEGGRWTCGRMGVILLSNLVFGKRLLCDVVPGEKETVLNNCLSGRKNIAREILTRGFGRVDENSPLMPFQVEAQKAAAGLWRNPDCRLDFDRC